MDIICAKCGRHFSSIEDARQHRGHCKETSEGEAIRWIPAPKSKITPEEWESLMKLINPRDVSPPKAPSDIELTAIESTSSREHAETKTSISSSSTAGSKGSPDEKKADKSGIKKTANYRIPNWLIALLFIFSLSVIGLGISLYIGSFIPFWLLTGFSFIYSIEKWFIYFTRKYKVIGRLYRLLLNFSILSLLGLIIWSGIKLFSQQFIYSPLAGSLIFLAEFVLFIWMWRVVAKNSWRWPSMKLTVFSLICLFVIFAFAGVQPVSSYKDNVISKLNTYWTEQKLKTEENLEQAKIETQKRIEEQRIEEQKAKEAQIQTELNQNYAQLFNKFRAENGKLPLTFDPKLNELASQRAIEISQPGNFSHEGIKKYNLGENIAMMAYSTDSNTRLLEQWANSSGHRSNMLSSMYTRTGFARVGSYVVQIFD